MALLKPAEIAHYRQQGWVVPAWRLPAAQVVVMQNALDELLRRNRRRSQYQNDDRGEASPHDAPSRGQGPPDAVPIAPSGASAKGKSVE